MVDVLGLHGIGQQQSGRNQMLPDWQAGLNDGVERARGRDFPKPSLNLAYYGDLFLTDTDGNKGALDTGGSGTGKSGDFENFDADLVSFLERVQDEVVDPHEALEPEIPGTTKGLPRSVTRLGALLERRFGVAGKLLFFGDLVQVRRFQRDDPLAARVLDRLGELLADGPRVLVGHSLGSIVAFEALCMVPDHSVHTLITLGSPLGMRSIRGALRPPALRRLPHLPPGVVRWVNIYDPRDPVSLAGGLAEYWPEVEDATVDNGKSAHAVLHYLGKKVTGEAISVALS
ncbi:alpha/beta fold hydrolase [Mesorhizobium prunaredense]|nr:alpha/beta hydrolase [Mesorhizobium prunaredense]